MRSRCGSRFTDPTTVLGGKYIWPVPLWTSKEHRHRFFSQPTGKHSASITASSSTTHYTITRPRHHQLRYTHQPASATMCFFRVTYYTGCGCTIKTLVQQCSQGELSNRTVSTAGKINDQQATGMETVLSGRTTSESPLPAIAVRPPAPSCHLHLVGRAK